jgi:hypothetical protein
MLTKAENEMLTRVDAGTPAGELLRRYWLPVAVASELTADHPARLSYCFAMGADGSV